MIEFNKYMKILIGGIDTEYTTNENGYYSEVYGVLQSLGEKYIEKLPQSVFEFIEKNGKDKYKLYDMSIPLSRQNISKKALSLICSFHLRYWCINENEEMVIKDIIKKNTAKAEEEKKKTYSSDVFANKCLTEKQTNNNEEKQLIEIKDRWYKRLFKRIKMFFER